MVNDSHRDTSGVRVMMDLKVAAAFHKGESPFEYFFNSPPKGDRKRERE